MRKKLLPILIAHLTAFFWLLCPSVLCRPSGSVAVMHPRSHSAPQVGLHRRHLKKSKKSNNVFERYEDSNGKGKGKGSGKSQKGKGKGQGKGSGKGKGMPSNMNGGKGMWNDRNGKGKGGVTEHGTMPTRSPTSAPTPASPPILQLVREFQFQTGGGWGALPGNLFVPPSSPSTDENASASGTRASIGSRSVDISGLQSRNTPVECRLDANGFFTTSVDFEGTVHEIRFLYQVYVDSRTSIAVLRSQVISDLDVALAQSILPAFFNCIDSRRRFLQVTQPEGAITAVSSRRPDEIAFGLNCTGSVPEAISCHVVEGYITVLATGFRNAAAVEEVLLPAVFAVMQSGQLRSVNQLILDVQPLNLDLSTMGPVPTRSPTTPAPVTDGPSLSSPTLSPSEVGTSEVSVDPSESETDETEDTSPPSPTDRPETQAPSGETPPVPIQSRSKDGIEGVIDKFDWWHWVLFGVGVAGIVLCLCITFRGRSGGGSSTAATKPPRNRAASTGTGTMTGIGSASNKVRPKNSVSADEIDPYDTRYEPPGANGGTLQSIPEQRQADRLGTFTITPNVPASFSSPAVVATDEVDDHDEGEEDEEASDADEEIEYFEDEAGEGEEEEGEEEEVDMEYGDPDHDDGAGGDEYVEDRPDMEYGEERGYDNASADDEVVSEEFAEEDYGDDQEEMVEESYYEEEEATEQDENHHASTTGWESQYSVKKGY